MKPISILVPNRFTWDAVILTIESILKRTDNPDFRIIVADNSQAEARFDCEPHERRTIDGDNGNRLAYLRRMALEGKITLIENQSQTRHTYGHGDNIRVLLNACNTPLALLFISTAEILRPDWLTALASKIIVPRDLGVARFRAGGQHFENAWRMPVYWPNIMLLNMEEYSKFGHINEDWGLQHVPLSKFHRPEEFAGKRPPSAALEDPLVFCDTAWRFTERIMRENPTGYMMHPLPSGYYTRHIQLFSGIDRNSHRPYLPYVSEKLAAIKERLATLRAE